MWSSNSEWAIAQACASSWNLARGEVEWSKSSSAGHSSAILSRRPANCPAAKRRQNAVQLEMFSLILESLTTILAKTKDLTEKKLTTNSCKTYDSSSAVLSNSYVFLLMNYKSFLCEHKQWKFKLIMVSYVVVISYSFLSLGWFISHRYFILLCE